MIRVSVENYVASATVTASSEAAAWPAVYIQEPQNPFVPARTNTTGGQSWTIDHGSARTVDVWALIRANFTSVRIQADDADTFDSAAGSPQYDSGVLTIARSRANRRYHHVHRPASPVTRRYNRIVVPSQTPVDFLGHVGAGYYLLGGVWAGPWLTVPRDIMLGARVHTIEPRLDATPAHAGWRARQTVGYPIAHLTLRRRAQTFVPTVATSEVAQWQEIERVWALADFALVSLTDYDASQGWIMRRLSESDWQDDGPWSDSDLDCEEVIQWHTTPVPALLAEVDLA
jgi:hypothetical protein